MKCASDQVTTGKMTPGMSIQYPFNTILGQNIIITKSVKRPEMMSTFSSVTAVTKSMSNILRKKNNNNNKNRSALTVFYV